MRIFARRDGACSACGVSILQGAECDWDRLFGARCKDCESARRYPPRPNGRSETCGHCGVWVPAGAGVLEPMGRSGWVVLCRDVADCHTRAERANRRRMDLVEAAVGLERDVEEFLARASSGRLVGLPSGTVSKLLRAGGWPVEGGRAVEVMVAFTELGRAYLVTYAGEPDGTWVKRAQRVPLEGIELTEAQRADALWLLARSVPVAGLAHPPGV